MFRRGIVAGFVALALTLGLAAPAAAGPFEDAMTAYARGDYPTALQIWHPLAEQSDAIAQANLGAVHNDGKGAPQDFVAAVKWYRKAADQGEAHAQLDLGVMYLNGQGVPQDYVQAHMWLNLAAAASDGRAELHDLAVKNRDSVAAKMTPAQIAEVQRLAREWKPKSN
jgi:TPR repeat protein